MSRARGRSGFSTRSTGLRIRGVRAKTRKSSAKRSSGRTRLSAKSTVDHDEIREWVEARGGHPATVKGTVRGKQAAGVLRIDFPGFSGERSLKPISWDEWFDIFEQCGLAFLRQERTASGKPSRFNKLVARE